MHIGNLIKFIPESPYSDPSYHLPHFYEIFAERANEQDRPFWKKAAAANRLQIWFAENTTLGEYDSYMLDGTPVGIPALHPTAVIATTAATSLASDNEYRLQWVKDFWDTPLRKGVRRYYDNFLYLFCLLMLSGEYKIY